MQSAIEVAAFLAAGDRLPGDVLSTGGGVFCSWNRTTMAHENCRMSTRLWRGPAQVEPRLSSALKMITSLKFAPSTCHA